MISRMATEGRRKRHAVVSAAVVGGAHIVERLHLQHEVIEAFGRADPLVQRQGVMARIAVEEPEGRVDAFKWFHNIVADAHAQRVLVEPHALAEIVDHEDEMPKTQGTRLETAYRSRGDEWVRRHQGTVEDLRGDPVGL